MATGRAGAAMKQCLFASLWIALFINLALWQVFFLLKPASYYVCWPIYPKLGRHSDNPWQGSAADKHQKAPRAMITWVAIHGLERFSVFVLSAKLLVRLLVVAFLVCRYQLSWCAPAFLVDGQLSWCSVLRAVALPQLVRVVASSLELS